MHRNQIVRQVKRDYCIRALIITFFFLKASKMTYGRDCIPVGPPLVAFVLLFNLCVRRRESITFLTSFLYFGYERNVIICTINDQVFVIGGETNWRRI